jgi:hypothetical protein
LLNVEARWSYTVFLGVLARYLAVKEEMGQKDHMFAYAQATLLHYARWLMANETFYFDNPEKLEYPTETWAAQELRKGNVLRLAAVYTDEPLRVRFLQQAHEFSQRSWQDLFRFGSRTATRPVAILLVEGLKDHLLRTSEVARPVDSAGNHGFGDPSHFIPQRNKVRSQLKSWGCFPQSLLRLANPRRWLRYLSGRRKHL